MKALLVQARDPEDPVKAQELRCFSNQTGIPMDAIQTANATEMQPFPLENVDVVFIGGSGQYSATQQLPWTEPVLDLIREIHDRKIPLFGSCWGFHMIARAFGGSVVTDEAAIELGTMPVSRTEQSKKDPLFGGLPPTFLAHLGHKDNVRELPSNAVHLASSSMHRYQALRIANTQIYATQFHPELTANDMRVRLQNYMDCGYVPEEEKPRMQEILAAFRETPVCNTILAKFLQQINI